MLCFKSVFVLILEFDEVWNFVIGKIFILVMLELYFYIYRNIY